MSENNGHDLTDDEDRLPEAKPPTLGIAHTEAHGADPEGKEAIILINSVTGQAVQLHFAGIEQLADFAVAVRATLNQMRQNSRAHGDDLQIASPVKKFAVGHVIGTPGTMMALDPDTPNEATYILDNAGAIDLGKLLVTTAGKRQRIDDAIRGGSKLTTPPKPRLILPGEN